jgi:glycerophosphoryl diester phosphodiesterase
MTRLVKILLLCLLLLFISTITTNDKGMDFFKLRTKHQVKIIAHRGASGYAPENTMAAFEEAVKIKADYIELDVQMTRDGELVVIHDIVVDRTTMGKGKVGEFTLAELKELDAGSWLRSEFEAEQIPTLREVLDEFYGKIGILIEFKAPWLYPGIEQEVASLLREYPMKNLQEEGIIVQSFDHQSMKKFKRLFPEIPNGILIYKGNHLTYSKLKEFSNYANYINPRTDLVTLDLINQVHSNDMKIMIWTLGDPADIDPFVKARVDGIITDYPDKAWNSNFLEQAKVGLILLLVIVLVIFFQKGVKRNPLEEEEELDIIVQIRKLQGK